MGMVGGSNSGAPAGAPYIQGVKVRQLTASAWYARARASRRMAGRWTRRAKEALDNGSFEDSETLHLLAFRCRDDAARQTEEARRTARAARAARRGGAA